MDGNGGWLKGLVVCNVVIWGVWSRIIVNMVRMGRILSVGWVQWEGVKRCSGRDWCPGWAGALGWGLWRGGRAGEAVGRGWWCGVGLQEGPWILMGGVLCDDGIWVWVVGSGTGGWECGFGPFFIQ